MSKVYLADKETLDSVKKNTEDIKSSIESMSSGGIAPGNMRMFYIQPGDTKVKIKFREPEDTIIDGQTICTWKGVRIVMNDERYPEDETDGTVILDCCEAGKYSEEEFEYEGLENEKTYYFQAFPYSDYYIYNRNSKNRAICTPKEYLLYGIKIDKNDSNPATRVSYTEMAVGKQPASVDLSTGAFNYGDWADEWFVTENKPYMVYSSGEAAYELDPNDYTKKVDGTDSDVSNTSFDGNAMAKIPLVWMKQWEDEEYEYCNICNIQLDDSYKAYAHMRADGSIMDYIWLSMFEGSNTGGKIRSIKGLTPANKLSGTTEISYATANGSLWYTRTYSQRNLINMLLLLMSCSDDGQTAYGYGYYTGGSESSSTYLSTGYRSDKGQFYGTNATRDAVKVFHIENWWGDVWERIAGCIYDTEGVFKIKMYPEYNTDGTGYTKTEVSMDGTNGGYISKSVMSEYGRLPKTVSGSETTYQCDGGWYNKTQSNYAIAGGDSADGFRVGPSCLLVNNLVSHAHWHLGVALSCEQPVAA